MTCIKVEAHITIKSVRSEISFRKHQELLSQTKLKVFSKCSVEIKQRQQQKSESYFLKNFQNFKSKTKWFTSRTSQTSTSKRRLSTNRIPDRRPVPDFRSNRSSIATITILLQSWILTFTSF